MSGKVKNKKDTKSWTPFDIKDCPPEDLARRLKRWLDNPTTEPVLEEWYQTGYPKGLPFAERKPDQWELDHKKYYPIYEQARVLEKNGQPEEALRLYMEIMHNYTPYGTAYYERPTIILERLGRFEEAIIICDRAIRAINNNLFHGDIEPFEKRKKRLEKKISNRGDL